MLPFSACPESLMKKAHAHLGNIDRHFTRIIEFWSNMAAVVKALRDESTSGTVYFTQIVNSRLAEKFKKSIFRVKKVIT